MKIKGLRQSNKGFTLAEICVTFVIISVLASITTFGLIAWQHDSMFNKQQQNAELVYMAARNKIAMYNANKVAFETTPIYCDIEDYEKYKYSYSKEDNNNTSLKQEKQQAWKLFNMISEYTYDKTILNAYIYIEFDDKNNIKCVYYSEKTKFFDSSGNIKNEYNDDSQRYDDVVGTYSP